MKLTTVLGSTNENPSYYRFIPKQILFWSKFKIKFIAIFIGESIPDELLNYNENIILWNKNSNLNSAFVAQNIRMYYPSLLNLSDDEYVMITDMDMLPCNDKYFKEDLYKFNKEDFIYYRNIDNLQIYMCYNAAHPSLWSKLFNINNETDIVNSLNNTYDLKYNGIPGDHGWSIDQEIMYKKLHKYINLKVLNKPIKRLETLTYITHIKNNDTDFYMNYDDAHFHRNYENNKKLIKNAENQLNKIIE
jgi:hypothetical protein